mmetsp:Transcript_16128/g.23924  ORF Transcript_16128/g.23924 Transcript_16128/m.23924 type:complete len:179 (-) Transcript_16128:136-672(-)
MESSSNQTAASRHTQDANATTDLNNDDERRSGQYTSVTVNDSSGGASSGAAGMATSTMVITQQRQSQTNNIEEPILRLSLRPQSNVTWDQNVVNNEGLGRKSSKRCAYGTKKEHLGNHRLSHPRKMAMMIIAHHPLLRVERGVVGRRGQLPKRKTRRWVELVNQRFLTIKDFTRKISQ